MDEGKVRFWKMVIENLMVKGRLKSSYEGVAVSFAENVRGQCFKYRYISLVLFWQ